MRWFIASYYRNFFLVVDGIVYMIPSNVLGIYTNSTFPFCTTFCAHRRNGPWNEILADPIKYKKSFKYTTIVMYIHTKTNEKYRWKQIFVTFLNRGFMCNWSQLCIYLPRDCPTKMQLEHFAPGGNECRAPTVLFLLTIISFKTKRSVKWNPNAKKVPMFFYSYLHYTTLYN